jgi:hypothetical protein
MASKNLALGKRPQERIEFGQIFLALRSRNGSKKWKTNGKPRSAGYTIAAVWCWW